MHVGKMGAALAWTSTNGYDGRGGPGRQRVSHGNPPPARYWKLPRGLTQHLNYGRTAHTANMLRSDVASFYCRASFGLTPHPRNKNKLLPLVTPLLKWKKITGRYWDSVLLTICLVYCLGLLLHLSTKCHFTAALSSW